MNTCAMPIALVARLAAANPMHSAMNIGRPEPARWTQVAITTTRTVAAIMPALDRASDHGGTPANAAEPIADRVNRSRSATSAPAPLIQAIGLRPDL